MPHMSTALTGPTSQQRREERQGLTPAEVAERRSAGHTNITEMSTSRSLADIVLANVFTRLNLVLGVLLVAVLASGRWADAVFGLPLLGNTLFGVGQEWMAKCKLDHLALVHSPRTRVWRDSRLVEVTPAELVLDDVIELRAGDVVPADGRVLAEAGMELDESSLTGESDPVAAHIGDEVRSGSAVQSGSATVRLTAVGGNAFIHQITAEARRFRRARSEVRAETDRFITYMSWAMAVLLPLLLWSQFDVYRTAGWREYVVRVSAAAVGLVPEGLVLLTTMAFLVAAVRLGRRQVMVQDLAAIEVLARVDTVCLDKTGTLTEGDLEVAQVLHAPGSHLRHEECRTVLGALSDRADANRTLQAIARFATDAPGSAPGGVGLGHGEGVVTLEGAVPFNSRRRWSGGVIGGAGRLDGPWVLGAPDTLLPAWHLLLTTAGTMAAAGERVLVFARVENLDDPDRLGDDQRTVQPVALVTLRERVRDDARATLDELRQEGIEAKIISGDDPRTAAAVARQVGLEPGEPVDASRMDDEQLAAVATTHTVFGRVAPHQKRMLVRALKADGRSVAMTGDGVNDVLALKEADLGITVGSHAAPAARGAAQLLLLDGRFSQLPQVLVEGRRLMVNLERTASLFVVKNVMAAVSIVVLALFSLRFPYLPRQLTLLASLTVGIPSTFLALASHSRPYQPGFLRRVLRFSVPCGLVLGCMAFVPSILGHARTGAQNAALGLLPMFLVSLGVLAACSRPWQSWKAAVLAASGGAAVLILSMPRLRAFLDVDFSSPLLGRAVVLGVVGMLAVEVVHHLHERRPVCENTPA